MKPASNAAAAPSVGPRTRSQKYPPAQTQSPSSATNRRLRADARRNHELLVEAARQAFTELGPDAPLDEIARRAGVGAGTLYRRFPSRIDLLEAVFQNRIEAVTVQAKELLSAPSPSDALVRWLRTVVEHSTMHRGLAASLMALRLERGGASTASSHEAMRTAGSALVVRAQQAGEIRTDVDAISVLKLVNAVAWASEQSPDGPDHTEKMLTIVMDGLRSCSCTH